MEIEKHEGIALVRAPAEMESKQRIPYFVGISGENSGARGICMNLVVIPPGGAAEPHGHRGYETALYLLKGRALCRFGPGLEQSVVLEQGNFLYIGPNVWHQPVNLSDTQEAVAVVARNDPNEQENVVLYEEDKPSAAG